MNSDSVYLKIDQKWNMDELAQLAKLYNQCYSLVYSISGFQTDSSDERVIDWFQGVYAKYPWRGGFSAVNFYNSLYSKIPIAERPNITKIKYESPGFIELQEVVVVAGSIASIVAAVTISIDRINKTYHNIQMGLSERRLTRMKEALAKVELDSAELDFIRKSKAKLILEMKIPIEMQLELSRRSDGNELMELKIIMSLYRRIEPLAKMQSEGMLKVEHPTENSIGSEYDET